MYVFNMFDYQTGGISLLFLAFCEAAVIGWALGNTSITAMLLFEVYLMQKVPNLLCSLRYFQNLAVED